MTTIMFDSLSSSQDGAEQEEEGKDQGAHVGGSHEGNDDERAEAMCVKAGKEDHMEGRHWKVMDPYYTNTASKTQKTRQGL